MLKILSFNVNSLRNKLHLIEELNTFDIICLQETKLNKNIVDDMELEGFYDFHNISNKKKGYAGVSVYSKIKPINVIEVSHDLDKTPFDEVRILALDYGSIILICSYCPYSGSKLEKLEYKIEWYEEFLKFVKTLKKPYIIAGDMNCLISNSKNDIYTDNKQKQPGATKIEINFLNHFIETLDLVDIYRKLHPTEIKYTYWSNFNKSRDRNLGWRLDYFLISKSLVDKVVDTDILTNFKGSDHCPIILFIIL